MAPRVRPSNPTVGTGSRHSAGAEERYFADVAAGRYRRGRADTSSGNARSSESGMYLRQPRDILRERLGADIHGCRGEGPLGAHFDRCCARFRRQLSAGSGFAKSGTVAVASRQVRPTDDLEHGDPMPRRSPSKQPFAASVKIDDFPDAYVFIQPAECLGTSAQSCSARNNQKTSSRLFNPKFTVFVSTHDLTGPKISWNSSFEIGSLKHSEGPSRKSREEYFDPSSFGA